MHTPKGLKEKAKHEVKEYFGITLFLAFFFGAFGEYRALIMRQFDIEYFQYGEAIITALIMAKIIMIGEYVGVGTRHEQKPLIISTFYKALLFSLLAAVFHVIEEAIKALLHHKKLAEAFDAVLTPTGRYELLGRALVVFCVFVPFFALREIRRVLPPGQLYDLFFRRARLSNVSPSSPSSAAA